ncbi:hypothetical protein PP938_gp170 [Rhizobium phage AF3]|uniref:Uncharacterized protein n=1 Tax=Rhizobium phage AF3 TaxID=2763529 RepID=A0A7G7WWG6_9CAUD|nr:hypothetical protein PP938_gp170 [Rhizobium phage AF3]QNH71560.1 hypothetical protein AF3_170 [Rhizobium phage AF3]
MKVEFILIASGSLTMPQIRHSIFEVSDILAKGEAVKVVSQLSKAGYFLFDLIDVRDETHVRIESYKVETPEPVVTVKGKK